MLHPKHGWSWALEAPITTYHFTPRLRFVPPYLFAFGAHIHEGRLPAPPAAPTVLNTFMTNFPYYSEASYAQAALKGRIKLDGCVVAPDTLVSANQVGLCHRSVQCKLID